MRRSRGTMINVTTRASKSITHIWERMESRVLTLNAYFLNGPRTERPHKSLRNLTQFDFV